MSSKIECGFDCVDGKHVPTVKVMLEPCGPDDSAAWEARDLLAKKVEQALAAHVVERQPVVIDLDAVDWERIQKAADESSWMPNEYMRNEWVSDVCNFLKYGRAEHPAPPELAELQATIAQLTAENERLALELETITADRDAEKDMKAKAREQRDRVTAEIERLKGGQGEPVGVVAHRIDEIGQSFEGVIYATPILMGLVEDGTLLYASQPAQVLMQMPERFHLIKDLYAEGWNACLDKVKELNQ